MDESCVQAHICASLSQKIHFTRRGRQCSDFSNGLSTRPSLRFLATAQKIHYTYVFPIVVKFIGIISRYFTLLYTFFGLHFRFKLIRKKVRQSHGCLSGNNSQCLRSEKQHIVRDECHQSKLLFIFHHALTLIKRVFGWNWEKGVFLSESSLRPLSEAWMILSTLASGFQTEHANIFASPAGKVQTCILESSDVITIRGATNLCVTDMVLCRVLYVFVL